MNLKNFLKEGKMSKIKFTFTFTEWAIIVLHELEEAYTDEQLKNNLIEKIDAMIEKKKVPLDLRKGVRSNIKSHFKKYKSTVYYFSDPKNKNIKKCNPSVSKECFSHHINLLQEQQGYNEALKERELNSKEIIEKFPSPESDEYTHKGLVIGKIQSGKTANIEALICRAVDCGYRFIVVMCGMTNALRIQTQRRFDEEVLKNNPIFFKLSNEDGFRPGTFDIDKTENTAKIVIIKKISSDFKKILKAIEGDSELRNHPCLIIDDECDHASIDTNANKPNKEATATNQYIRDLIGDFKRVVYVGFSATPFANVFIDANNPDDLYPRDFIFIIDPPQGYTGTKEFIENYEDNFIVISGNGNQSDEDLKRAIYSFVISSCLVKANKSISIKGNNFSMLIHPSFKTSKHREYETKAKDIVKELQVFTEYPDKFKEIKDKFKDIFEKDFDLPDECFEECFKHHKDFINKIEIKKMNSDSDDDSESDNSLDYREGNKAYIIIGGNILSRGLTIEGLLTSFFIRESQREHQCDTLMQMQRWCGFRKDYLEYIKTYTTERLKKECIELVIIEEKFLEDTKKLYKEKNLSPLEFKPRVKEYYNMRVVSKSKEGKAQSSMAYTNPNRPIVKFNSSIGSLETNIAVAREFVKNKKINNYNCLISVDEVLKFIEGYDFYDESKEKIIKAQVEKLKNIYPEWKLIINNMVSEKGTRNHDDFKYSDTLKAKKVHRGLKPIKNGLRVEALQHKIEDEIDEPNLILYVIDEDSNKKLKKLDENLRSELPIIAPYFRFPSDIRENDGDRYWQQE